MDLNETAVFVKVVQAGSFSAAARQLELPTSTVSTRVARLERRLGVTLIQRTTRRLHLTEVGELYYQEAAIGLGHLLEAEAAATASVGEAKGLLRVTAPMDFGDALFAGLIAGLRRGHPGISLELILADRFVDLVAEGVDVAIRVGKLQDSTLIAKKVGVACWAPYASPNYLRGAPPLAKPQALRKHRCLPFTPLGKDQWTLSDGKGSVTVPLAGQVIANDVGIIRAMALSGDGVALLPNYVCREEAEAGRLCARPRSVPPRLRGPSRRRRFPTQQQSARPENLNSKVTASCRRKPACPGGTAWPAGWRATSHAWPRGRATPRRRHPSARLWGPSRVGAYARAAGP